MPALFARCRFDGYSSCLYRFLRLGATGWFIRLLARVADRTSHGVTDDDNLRRICSAEAATFTIRRVLADFYALKCSGWLTPMPSPNGMFLHLQGRFDIVYYGILPLHASYLRGRFGSSCPVLALSTVLYSPLVPDELGVGCPPIPGRWPSASGHRGRFHRRRL